MFLDGAQIQPFQPSYPKEYVLAIANSADGLTNSIAETDFSPMYGSSQLLYHLVSTEGCLFEVLNPFTILVLNN